MPLEAERWEYGNGVKGLLVVRLAHAACSAFRSLSGAPGVKQDLSAQKQLQVMLNGKVEPCQKTILCNSQELGLYPLGTADH